MMNLMFTWKVTGEDLNLGMLITISEWSRVFFGRQDSNDEIWMITVDEDDQDRWLSGGFLSFYQSH